MNEIVKQIAWMLDGMGYREEPYHDALMLAKDNNIVIVYGASDDLMEFRGAVSAELDAYEGTTIYMTRGGFVPEPDCDCDWAKEWFAEKKKNAVAIHALWCKAEDYSWTYETDIPHETFNIYDDGEPYCRGIVFCLDDMGV